MACGVVYLPMIYKNGKEIPASDPYILMSNGTVEKLKTDKTHLRKITIEQKKNYLIFRAKASYTLYYWDTTGKWISLGSKTPGALIFPNTYLQYENTPFNALFILIPEYSEGKERPFTIDNNGKINWW
jgi:hypothetical protein